MSHPENAPCHTVFHEGFVGSQYDAARVIQSGQQEIVLVGLISSRSKQTSSLPDSWGAYPPRHATRTLVGSCPLADPQLIRPHEVDPSSCTHRRECDRDHRWVLDLRRWCRWCSGGMSGGVSARVCALISSFGCFGWDGWLMGAIVLPIAFTNEPRWRGRWNFSRVLKSWLDA